VRSETGMEKQPFVYSGIPAIFTSWQGIYGRSFLPFLS